MLLRYGNSINYARIKRRDKKTYAHSVTCFGGLIRCCCCFMLLFTNHTYTHTHTRARSNSRTYCNVYIKKNQPFLKSNTLSTTIKGSTVFTNSTRIEQFLRFFQHFLLLFVSCFFVFFLNITCFLFACLQYTFPFRSCHRLCFVFREKLQKRSDINITKHVNLGIV